MNRKEILNLIAGLFWLSLGLSGIAFQIFIIIESNYVIDWLSVAITVIAGYLIFDGFSRVRKSLKGVEK